MARPSPRPLSDLATALRRRPRQGVAGVFQRFALVVLPAPAAAPSTAVAIVAPPPPALPPPEAGHLVARERARRALAEARQAMTGVLGDDRRPAGGPSGPDGEPLSPDIERLRAHLEEAERERATLRQELAEVKATVEAIRRRLDAVERDHARPNEPAAPPPPAEPFVSDADAGVPEPAASAGGQEPNVPSTDARTTGTTPAPAERATDDQSVRDLRERVLRALRDRIFAAGTVGTRVEIDPAPTQEALDAIVARFDDEPFVEHAEPIGGDAGAAALRVTLRTPLRWEQFGGVLERALDQPLAHGDVSWSHGAVRVRLAPAPTAHPAGAADEPTPDGG